LVLNLFKGCGNRLLGNLLLNKIDVVLLEAHGQRPGIVSAGDIVGVLDGDDLVVSHEAREVFVSHLELVVVKPSFVGNLVGHELGMVVGQDSLVEALFLVHAFHGVGVTKLGHLDVVGKDVERQVSSFRNGHKLHVMSVGGLGHVVQGVRVLSMPTAGDGGERRNPLLKSVVAG